MARADYYICPLCDGKAMYNGGIDFDEYAIALHPTCLTKVLADITRAAQSGPHAAEQAVTGAIATMITNHAADCDNCDHEPCFTHTKLTSALTAITAA